jgi:hypothetical protein
MKHSVKKLLGDQTENGERPEIITRDRIRLRPRRPSDRSRMPVNRLLAHVERRMVASRPLTIKALRELSRAFELADWLREAGERAENQAVLPQVS